MGAATDPMAVLDPELRVKGVRDLRVVDASAMPKLPYVNPNITVDDDGREVRRPDPRNLMIRC